MRHEAEEAAQRIGSTVVPLYTAPQPAKGWLMAEERRALERAFDLLCDDDGDNPLAGKVQMLLARSSPPEVVLPERWLVNREWQEARDTQWLAALTAAGLEVKEVGRE